MATDVVFGANGCVGREVVRLLLERGRCVRAVTRSGTGPSGTELVAGDAREARRYCDGAEVVYSCVGTGYADWLKFWPPVVEGLAEVGERLVFADNLYGYGPSDEVLHEDMPVNPYGRKPALRAAHWRRLLGAGAALVRASDLYGPGVTQSVLGERVFGRVVAGRPAQLLGEIDQPHAFSYLGDFARALVTVGADAQARKRAWQVPNAPALSVREMVLRIFELAGEQPRLQVMPDWLVTVMGWFSPLFFELRELRFAWDRPYLVDHSRFADRFWGDPTPLEEGLRATLDWYRTVGGGNGKRPETSAGNG